MTLGDVGWLWGVGNLLPIAPVFSVVPGVHALTVTLENEDETVTNYVQYKGTDDLEWNSGGNIVGDGDIVIEQLDNEVPYIISVHSINGAGFVSVPAVSVIATLREFGMIDLGDC